MMTATNVDLDPVDVLRSVADCSHARTRAEADLFAAAVAWADLNPTTPDNPFAVQWWDGERVDDGEPEVAASAVAEFAATAGLSQYAGKSLMHEALLLRQRMPRTWLLVQQCRIPAFRAQQLVATALHLGASALGWLDEQTAAVNGRIGRASIDRMVARAEAMFGQASDSDRPRRTYELIMVCRDTSVRRDWTVTSRFLTLLILKPRCRRVRRIVRLTGRRMIAMPAGRWLSATWPGTGSGRTFSRRHRSMMSAGSPHRGSLGRGRSRCTSTCQPPQRRGSVAQRGRS
ncbi:hypothetical protein ACQBAR_03350 [Propionibacteriaceae bacterium Y1685]